MVSIPQTIQEKTIAALQGDSSAFGSLFEWYRPRLYAHALRLCGNNPLVKDAIQETFISAFINYHSLRNASLFYPWLKKILHNHCLRLLSKEKNKQPLDQLEKNDHILQSSILENLDKSANIQWVHEAMNQLSDALKSCVLLRYFSNYKSYGEIAQVLGIPVGTVRSRLSAAREKLLSCQSWLDEADDKALQESKKWASYYKYLWDYLYDDHAVRQELIEHFHPGLHIRFTSGRMAMGREKLIKEVNDDLHHGSAFRLKEIACSGNIAVIEGVNVNSIEYPDRCPVSTVFVTFRGENKIETFHIFDSARPV